MNPAEHGDWPALRQRIWELHKQGWEQERIAETLAVPVAAVARWLRDMAATERRRVDELVEHIRLPSAQNIHLFRSATGVADARSILPEIAQRLKYHCAIFDGSGISSKPALLAQLARLYEFPDYQGDGNVHPTWDGAIDFIRDLEWLTGRPRGDQVKGFLFACLNPEQLLAADALDFAMFLDVMAEGSRELQEEGLPLHIFIGPLVPRVDAFFRLLKVSHQACLTCAATPLLDFAHRPAINQT